jgi:hypothetical protein
MIYMCTYSEMRILQLIVSGTLANAGHPERVKNKTKQNKQTCAVGKKSESVNFPTKFHGPKLEATHSKVECSGKRLM